MNIMIVESCIIYFYLEIYLKISTGTENRQFIIFLDDEN